MATKYFETEEELDAEFERIEEVNFDYTILKDNVAEAHENVAEAERELEEFVEDNKDIIISV